MLLMFQNFSPSCCRPHPKGQRPALKLTFTPPPQTLHISLLTLCVTLTHNLLGTSFGSLCFEKYLYHLNTLHAVNICTLQVNTFHILAQNCAAKNTVHTFISFTAPTTFYLMFMHLNTKTYSLYGKTYMAINLILNLI